MFELLVRVVFSLAVVFGLLWFVARTSSRRFGGRARSMVRVVARQPLARTASLAIVEIGDRVLVVGVSEHGVSLLTEMDPSELPEELPEQVVRSAVSGTSGTSVNTTLATDRPLSGRLGVLSTDTWRQAWAAATSRNGSSGD